MSMMYENEEELFDPSSTDEFLSQVPLALIEENINIQFENPDNYRMDYVSEFIRSYLYSMRIVEDVDEKDSVEQLKDEFVDFMENAFTKRLGIGIENLEELGAESALNTVLFTYRFFVLNVRKNYLNFIYNYIQKNRVELVSKLPRKKDITSQAFKKTIDEDDVIILANLSKAIEICLYDERVDIDEFLTLCAGSTNSLEAEFVLDKFNNFEMTGNFLPRYRRMLKDSMKVRIEAEIRNRILKKYRDAQ